MDDFRTTSFASWKQTNQPKSWNDVVYAKKKLLYPSETWFNITSSLLLHGRNSSLVFFFRKSPTMEISSLHWAFEPHKRTCNSGYTVNGPATCQRSPSWWTGDQPISRTSELVLLEPVTTEGSLEHLSGEGLSKEGALSTSHPSANSILLLSFSSNLEDCSLQLAAVPFIVLCPKSPKWNVYWATLTFKHKERTRSRYFRHQALPSGHHYG